ncbi:disulfide bond formation protein B [Candidatus Microgenomates bacterium]|nr:disulfide bond formation protein B [Candidatus Microgenomates bacterium]
MLNFLQRNALYIAITQVLAGVFGSLYISELMKLPPCNLCWYQRALLYPLVIIIGWGLIRKDKNLHFYVLPFSVGGLIIASYHFLLQNGLAGKSLAGCTLNIPCDVKQIEWFGFITIPLLSFAAFFVVTICILAARKNIPTS